MFGGRMSWPRRRRRTVTVLPAALGVTVLLAGCGALGLDTTGPEEATVQTSAAPVASEGGAGGSAASSTGPAVAVPSLQTGTTSSRPAPTPWQSLTTSSAPPTTSEFTLTAPTTTRHSLSFAPPPSVTDPTAAAPTAMAAPPPDCYSDGSCPPVGSDSAGGGTVEVLNPSGGSTTIAVLKVSGRDPTAVPLARLASPRIDCAGTSCLVQGNKSGLHFGSVVRVVGGSLKAVSGTASSNAALRLHGSGSSIVVAGTHRFDGYGVGPSDSPVAARTWALSGGALKSTGCSAPRLYAKAPAATSAQHGSCSGTPRIAGYGSASAHKMVSLGGFVTPSGNIHCALLPGSKLYCTAKHHSFHVKTCTKSTKDVPKALRGLRVLLEKSGGMKHDGCLGYTLVGSPKSKISYNRLAVGGGFVCEVRESGVKCTAPSGHGFSLARAALDRF